MQRAASAVTHFRGFWYRRECEEYKRWRAVSAAEASGDTAAAEDALADLKIRDKEGNEREKKLPGGKVGPRPQGVRDEVLNGDSSGFRSAWLPCEIMQPEGEADVSAAEIRTTK